MKSTTSAQVSTYRQLICTLELQSKRPHQPIVWPIKDHVMVSNVIFQSIDFPSLILLLLLLLLLLHNLPAVSKEAGDEREVDDWTMQIAPHLQQSASHQCARMLSSPEQVPTESFRVHWPAQTILTNAENHSMSLPQPLRMLKNPSRIFKIIQDYQIHPFQWGLERLWTSRIPQRSQRIVSNPTRLSIRLETKSSRILPLT